MNLFSIPHTREKSQTKGNIISKMSEGEIKTAVAERYTQVAIDPRGQFNFPVGRKFAEAVGYPMALLDKLPSSFWESFTGAGNPQAFIDIVKGEVILDLGCGAGLDLFLYAQATGPLGKVYGLDLSLDMLNKAEKNLLTFNLHNYQFLWTSSDQIPLPDESVDLVTANGIYNLSPNKARVMREVVRVLKRGGRTIFAEIILKKELPEDIREDMDDWFRCIGGALTEEEMLNQLQLNGLQDPQVLWKGRNPRTRHPLALCAIIKAKKEGGIS